MGPKLIVLQQYLTDCLFLIIKPWLTLLPSNTSLRSKSRTSATVTIKYLLSNLYPNFTLLWPTKQAAYVVYKMYKIYGDPVLLKWMEYKSKWQLGYCMCSDIVDETCLWLSKLFLVYMFHILFPASSYEFRRQFWISLTYSKRRIAPKWQTKLFTFFLMLGVKDFSWLWFCLTSELSKWWLECLSTDFRQEEKGQRARAV